MKPCVETAFQAIQDGFTSYTPTQGIAELREAIAEHYLLEYGVRVHPDQVMVTMGSSPGMFLAFGTLTDAGEEILLPNPYYPPYPNNIRFLGGIAVEFNLRGSDGFRYDLDIIKAKITSRTKGIILNSPSNPTGMVQDEGIIRGLAEMAEKTGIFIISDEIYHGLTYGVKAHSILEYTDRALVLSGFSKRYAMTGWRLGWVIAPLEFIPAMKNLHMNYFLSASAFVQKAGVTALKAGKWTVEDMRATYQKRRDYLMPEILRLGFGLEAEPQGAFYLLVNAKKFSSNSLTLAGEILQDAGVALTPGIDFGSQAEGYLRISYATALAELKRAVARLGEWAEARGKET